MNETARTFAEKLLQIDALQIRPDQPFTWASGWRSPVYCDNRKLLSYPHIRDYVKSELANAILDHFPDAEVIAGVATAGIPHGSLAADLLRLPFAYVRSKPKGHGMGNQIEGLVRPGDKVVVVEDLVSTGKSSLEAVAALRAHGAEVIGMAALFTYGFPLATAAFEAAGLKLITLSDYEALSDLCKEKGQINEAQQERLAAWRLDPAGWEHDR